MPEDNMDENLQNVGILRDICTKSIFTDCVGWGGACAPSLFPVYFAYVTKNSLTSSIFHIADKNLQLITITKLLLRVVEPTTSLLRISINQTIFIKISRTTQDGH